MRFRWTMKELKENSDLEIIMRLLNERTSELDPYAPLAKKLNEIKDKIDKNKIIIFPDTVFAVVSKQGLHGIFLHDDDAEHFSNNIDSRIARNPKVEPRELRKNSGYSSHDGKTGRRFH